jgi:AcrR family transcriptional regulator
MGRRKTISDDDVLAVARGVFRARGHAASTREIARAAGVSEAVLYQRFETKERFFIAAMRPRPLDLREVFGTESPSGDPRLWIRRVVERMSSYFAEIVPLAIQVMLHPSFEVSRDGPTETASVSDRLEGELAARLRGLEGTRAIAAGAERAAARLLVSLAHDWALRSFLRRCDVATDRRLLVAMLEIAWQGLEPRKDAGPSAKGQPDRR